MEPHIPQPEAFLKEQERRRQKRLPDQIYDITAWSLPLVFDVDVVDLGDGDRRGLHARDGDRRPSRPGPRSRPLASATCCPGARARRRSSRMRCDRA